jgi:hypothetical protein
MRFASILFVILIGCGGNTPTSPSEVKDTDEVISSPSDVIPINTPTEVFTSEPSIIPEKRIDPVEIVLPEPVESEKSDWLGFALIGVPGAGGENLYENATKIGKPSDNYLEGNPDAEKIGAGGDFVERDFIEDFEP